MRGLTGVIEMASGNLTIHPWEDIDVEPHGCTVHHNDLYKTKTFIPVFTIKSIRWHEKEMEKQGPNVSGENMIHRRGSKAWGNVSDHDKEIMRNPPALEPGDDAGD